jgi:DNA-binding response OmpR family regulator
MAEHRPTTPSVELRRGARARVLVIDDEIDVRQLLAMALSQDGFEVEMAGSGPAALELLKTRKFNLAITDLMMPGMDGVATLVALKKAAPAMEVIVATGFSTVETAIACMRQGAFDYIKKPFNLAELKLRLDRALERSQHLEVVALYEATRTLMAAMVRGDLVRLVVSLAQKVLRADTIGLAVQDVEGGAWRYHHTVSTPHVGDPFVAALVLLVGDAREVLRFPSPALAELPLGSDDGKVSSALIFPLLSRRRTVGVLAALRGASSSQFNEFELHQGKVFCAEITTALDNECMYRELETKTQQPPEGK